MFNSLASFIRLSRLAVTVAVGGVLALSAWPAAAEELALQDRSRWTCGVPMSFSPLAKTQAPTVVNIAVTQPAVEEESRPPGIPGFPPGSLFNEFFKEFWERQREQQREQPHEQPHPGMALGSGFIIDAAGYVATNLHVISEATEIAVILHDGQRFSAKLVGADPLTDLAVLKIDSKEPLAATRWGDSDKMDVGDWVVAIGNPFGLGGSVSAGILSARARDIHQGPYDDYIQTDAAINRGNSGGPLYNLAGEVIGVNTAIYSPTGGSVGIGFAIPSALARPVIEQLKEHGAVRRGWLGVQVQKIGPDLAENLGMPAQKGALVTSVIAGSPAEKAGIRQGDVILGFAGKEIERMNQLPRVVAGIEPGRQVDVKLLRRGQGQTAMVTIGEMGTGETADEVQVAASGSSGEPPRHTQPFEKALGLTLSPLSPTMREAFALKSDAEGVVVAEVVENSAASEHGIEAGDIIVEVGQEAVKSPGEVLEKIKTARDQGRKSVLILVSHQGNLRYVPISLEERRG